MFVTATILPINMDALAFASAFIVGFLIMGMMTNDIFAGFPSDLFLTLVGITYLFAIAQNNGTIDWLVERAVRLVRSSLALGRSVRRPSLFSLRSLCVLPRNTASVRS